MTVNISSEMKIIGKFIAFVVFLNGLVFCGAYFLLEHDRSKMMAFVAKCEAAGNHAVFQNVDNGACFEGPAPKMIERYNEFK